jgi:hypothetical protein
VPALPGGHPATKRAADASVNGPLGSIVKVLMQAA